MSIETQHFYPLGKSGFEKVAILLYTETSQRCNFVSKNSDYTFAEKSLAFNSIL